MPLVTNPFRALIIGSSGTIGSAFLELLENDPNCTEVEGIHRNSACPIDYQDLSTIELAATALSSSAPFGLIINTIGLLHSSEWMPEKKLGDLQAEQLQNLMQVNAIGPSLTIKAFSKLLDPAGAVMATLSAKVGSIEDNRLGGWYSYRASKAALNMLIKTASIEFSRTKPNTALIALHPGTVNSRLSKPFKGEQLGRPPLEAAQDMLHVLLSLKKEDSGTFISYSGERLPW
ncbi:SDR family NAD(P)-dependent oxidoreductase [Polynucleobacter brandtiae]|uniref:NAD(P)-dependent dehydrogenase (Short-subunit alcohol dehydrogenase family) n=1 Tax=Polynucleobacter brandtiae TaxID=1938816 RepID=A0A2M8VZP3_9BURK|nr:SDR family NAD(P)-dependent oxidoreductase [Polynucleobacter brandtiae]PJI83318.1 NAD(P)-dependent dehydrogenase (short-subunit alcohol dehydrogenase family) [Polynucleobacter brandtiae]